MDHHINDVGSRQPLDGGNGFIVKLVVDKEERDRTCTVRERFIENVGS